MRRRPGTGGLMALVAGAAVFLALLTQASSANYLFLSGILCWPVLAFLHAMAIRRRVRWPSSEGSAISPDLRPGGRQLRRGLTVGSPAVLILGFVLLGIRPGPADPRLQLIAWSWAAIFTLILSILLFVLLLVLPRK